MRFLRLPCSKCGVEIHVRTLDVMYDVISRPCSDRKDETLFHRDETGFGRHPCG